MIKSNHHILLMIIFTISIFAGCTQSLLYSPSVNLPPKPLQKGQTQLLGGIGLYPETRPHQCEEKTAFGGEVSIRRAISDQITFQAKGWKDLSDNLDDDRFGFSFSIMAMFNDSSDFRFGIIPTGAFLFGRGEYEGGGGAIPFCFWFTKFDPFDFYASLGPAIGIHNIQTNSNQWGWGIIMNIGSAILVKDHLTINLELSGIKQVNEWEDINDYFLCPSFNLGYIF